MDNPKVHDLDKGHRPTPGGSPSPLQVKKSHALEWSIVGAVLAVGLAFAIQKQSSFVWRSNRTPPDKATMKGLEIAIKGYQIEYNRYPLATTEEKESVMLSEGKLLKVLMADDDEHNPRKVLFYDPIAARDGKGGYLLDSAGAPSLVDFYGQPYRICIDYDGDGEIIDPHSKDEKQPNTLSSGVIIWSGGKDGDPTTWKDNLLSWQ